MDYLEAIKEIFRPKLPVRQDILERERNFNATDPDRESWVLNHMYLCEGDLKALEKHPDYNDHNISHVFTRYASPQGKKGPCKKVVASVEKESDQEATMSALEIKLKLDLFSRGCNAGVQYQTYEKANTLVGEAIPAVITCE